jgi:hypothetical protein
MWKNTSSTNPTSPISVVSPAAAAPTYRLKYQGRRFAQIVKLKPECEEQYKACHANVWPEVLKQIKDCNIEDCKWPRGRLWHRQMGCGASYRRAPL